MENNKLEEVLDYGKPSEMDIKKLITTDLSMPENSVYFWGSELLTLKLHNPIQTY